MNPMQLRQIKETVGFIFSFLDQIVSLFNIVHDIILHMYCEPFIP